MRESAGWEGKEAVRGSGGQGGKQRPSAEVTAGKEKEVVRGSAGKGCKPKPSAEVPAGKEKRLSGEAPERAANRGRRRRRRLGRKRGCRGKHRIWVALGEVVAVARFRQSWIHGRSDRGRMQEKNGMDVNKTDENRNVAHRDLLEYISRKVSGCGTRGQDPSDMEDYSQILSEDGRWDIFYHLSEMRKSLFNWYDFRENASLLEVNGEYGALTGLFCDRCGEVTALEPCEDRAEAIRLRYRGRNNLRVYDCEPESFYSDARFDYIVVAGCLERQKDPVAFLGKMKKLLASGGTLLLTAENRFGIRYFCGATGPWVDKPFAGINAYQKGMTGHSFSRQELSETLARAGLNRQKFYYPLPDSQLPQMIYSDGRLPEPGIGERLIPYYYRKDTLVASENALYDELVRNDVFPFFANSFLVECAGGQECGVDYAAVTTDRGPERATATCVRSDGTVTKRAVYARGRESIGRALENIRALEKRGIGVVPHSLRGEEIVMPYMKAPLCSNHIRSLLTESGGAGKVEALFEELYGLILQSSERGSGKDNCFTESAEEDTGRSGCVTESAEADAGKAGCVTESAEEDTGKAGCVTESAEEDTGRSGCVTESAEADAGKAGCVTESAETDTGRESCLTEAAENLDWGPVLKTAYIEMIPLNCFYDDGKIMFFDQEFTRQNCPAKYVLYRALRYTYRFIPELGGALPLSRMQEKFGLSGLWNLFEKEEEAFLARVRNHRVYGNFYKWTGTDRLRILKNAYILMGNSYEQVRARELLERQRAQREAGSAKYGKGYIAGVFDLFHVGHLNLIRRAKENCSYLTVGVLTDELVVHFKKNSPYIPFEERIEIVRSCRYVDEAVAVTFENIGKLESWKQIGFDCQFSGSDYEHAPDWLEDKRRLEQVGATIEFLPYTQTTCSTKIKQVINSRLEQHKG